jgi:hypothetical protein
MFARSLPMGMVAILFSPKVGATVLVAIIIPFKSPNFPFYIIAKVIEKRKRTKNSRITMIREE